MPYETIVGRERKDLEKYGNSGVGYIGKHIVGTGEDAHLTTKVFVDLLKPHVMLICGKRGSGKSYSAANILEEFCKLPDELRKKMAFVVIDPMGIYWSMKYPNTQQQDLLKQWNMEPTDFSNKVKVYVPIKQKEEYTNANVPVDGTINISLKEFSAEDLILAFGFKRTDEISISLEKNFNSFIESEEHFGFDELIKKIRSDEETRKETRDALVNFLTVADQWGLIAKDGIRVEDLIKEGEVSVIDLSRMRSNELRQLLVSLITRRIFRARVLSRKEEETAKLAGERQKFTFPLTWLLLEEGHNFIPSDEKVASSDAITRIAKEGREPGIGLIVITQMPNKVHQDVLSQCDLVISFRLTSKNDLDALHTVYQSYMKEDLDRMINNLPRWPGSAIILDDNLEKVFSVNIRPRISWHSGGTAVVV
ncbi:MAG TPA: ATP-binding protein [archaeon]|nr:ATP-binding protein [archaeon]